MYFFLLFIHSSNVFHFIRFIYSCMYLFILFIYFFSFILLLISRATVGSVLVKQRINDMGEIELYNKILEYGGADYFDKGYQNPFNYVMVLFCCHRFGDAITHLWLAGRLLCAIQLTVMCLHYGLILPHVSLAHNPRHHHPLLVHSTSG